MKDKLNSLFLILKEKILPWIQNHYFAVSFFVVFATVFLKLPSLTYKAEMWAEMGTNYFYCALNRSFLDNLNTSDFGYLPLMPRLIALFLVKVLGVIENFPLAAQMISLCFVSFFATFINLNFFRTIIPNDLTRFLLSITFGIISDYELYTFINFSYFGFLPCLLILALEKEKLSNTYYIALLLLLFIVLCSKATFIIFMPVYGVFFCYYSYKKNLKESLFYGSLIAAIFVQLAFIYFHKGDGVKPDTGPALSLIEIINKSLYSVWSVLMSILVGKDYPKQIGIPGFNFLIFAILLFLFYLAVRKFYIRGQYIVIVFFLSCLYLILASVFLNIVALKVFYHGEKHTMDWVYYEKIWLFRWTYFPMVACLLGYGVLIANTIASRFRFVAVIIVALCCVRFSRRSLLDLKDNWGDKGNSNWTSYRKLLKDPDYFIPVNPASWGIIHRTKVIDSTNIYAPNLKGKKLRAVQIVKNLDHLPPVINVSAYDAINEKWQVAQRLDSGKGLSYYFYFSEKIRLGTIRYTDEKGKNISLGSPDVIFIAAD